MGEIKQTNFRVDQDRADAFRAYCEANGINQAVGFERMLEALEMQNAKAAIPARETEISEFERALRHLQAAYLGSLELNQQAEARIREEFARQLDAKDRTIADYQEQVKELKDEKAVLAADAAKSKTLQADLDAAVEQSRQDRNTAADRLAEKDRIISTLDGRIEMLEIQAAGYPELKADRDSLADQLRDANQTIKDLKKDHKAALDQAVRDAEKAQSNAVAEAKAEKDSQIADLKEQLQAARIKAAEDLRKAEKDAYAAEKAATEALHTEIHRLEGEKAQLMAQMAALQAKLTKES